MRRRPMAVNRPIGVLISPDEVTHVMHLLINLKADDLLLEEIRCDALAWITRLKQDIDRLEQDQQGSSVSTGDVA